MHLAALVSLGSLPSFAAVCRKVRCRETGQTLQSPLPAHSCRSELRMNVKGAPETDWKAWVRCRTLVRRALIAFPYQLDVRTPCNEHQSIM